MSSVLTGYSVYFNLKHRRSGHVTEGRYKAQVVGGDDYLLKLSRYIHLNPVRVAGLKDELLAKKLAVELLLEQLSGLRWARACGEIRGLWSVVGDDAGKRSARQGVLSRIRGRRAGGDG